MNPIYLIESLEDVVKKLEKKIDKMGFQIDDLEVENRDLKKANEDLEHQLNSDPAHWPKPAQYRERWSR